jgi:hypothetical protein
MSRTTPADRPSRRHGQSILGPLIGCITREGLVLAPRLQLSEGSA